MFKKIVAFVTGKVETAIEQNTSPEEAWRSAARILIKEIDRLQHTRVSAVQEIVKLKKKVKEHKDLHSGKESEIKNCWRRGRKCPTVIMCWRCNIVTSGRACRRRSKNWKG